ncbi:MAG: hypothetical protein ORN24_03865 [Burkholderiales bacterium]|nr:hypothetical protein [Burkholderiales bacterium]
MNEKKYAKQIVETILSQLGGNLFIAMTGVKLNYTINDKHQPVLQCFLPKDIKIKNNINIVLIAYNMGLDLYEYTFINAQDLNNIKIIKHICEVYAEDLIPLFEQETGMFCY